jgi:2-polyprenyl-6-methoxyphenol hydroxylase-like FAD-dependent oxidoreductase
MTHKDDGDIGESWQQPGNLEDVHKLVEGWSPDIVAAVHKMKDCLDWKICYRDPLPTWVSRSGKVALIGDSAHPHLPTSAQGASQATEDGAVLALCLTLAGKGNVPLATRTYEKLRYDRVRQAQKTGEDLRDRWHNALKQLNNNEEPDQEMLLMKVLFCTSQLTSNAWLYPHDAELDTKERWAEVSAQVAREMQEHTDSSTKLPNL